MSQDTPNFSSQKQTKFILSKIRKIYGIIGGVLNGYSSLAGHFPQFVIVSGQRTPITCRRHELIKFTVLPLQLLQLDADIKIITFSDLALFS